MTDQEEIDAAAAFRWLWELVEKYPLAAKNHGPYMNTLCTIHLKGLAAETCIAAAMKHHTRKRPVGFYEDWCDECDVLWPCPTVFALEGEE